MLMQIIDVNIWKHLVVPDQEFWDPHGLHRPLLYPLRLLRLILLVWSQTPLLPTPAISSEDNLLIRTRQGLSSQAWLWFGMPHVSKTEREGSCSVDKSRRQLELGWRSRNNLRRWSEPPWPERGGKSAPRPPQPIGSGLESCNITFLSTSSAAPYLKNKFKTHRCFLQYFRGEKRWNTHESRNP